MCISKLVALAYGQMNCVSFQIKLDDVTTYIYQLQNSLDKIFSNGKILWHIITYLHIS